MKDMAIKFGTISINVEETKRFVEEELVGFLVSHADFPVAAFCLQTLMEKIEEIEGEENNEHEEE